MPPALHPLPEESLKAAQKIIGTDANMSQEGDFAAVRADIAKLLHQPEYDDGSAGPVLVRLAWYVAAVAGRPRGNLSPLLTGIDSQALGRYL